MPRDVMPVDADGAILLRAAEIIEEGGWWDGGTEETFQEGHHCAQMAIRDAYGEYIPFNVIDRFAQRLGLADTGIATWNDAQPNAEAVTSRLRAAAYATVSA